jgi:hypothetical protein
MVFNLFLKQPNLKTKVMIVRLNPWLEVETPLGKGNAICYASSADQKDLYWIINQRDNTIRLFATHEVQLLEKTSNAR